MLYQIDTPKSDFMSFLTTGFSLCLKHDQRVTSGAAEKHQTSRPHYMLGVRWDGVALGC